MNRWLFLNQDSTIINITLRRLVMPLTFGRLLHFAMSKKSPFQPAKAPKISFKSSDGHGFHGISWPCKFTESEFHLTKWFHAHYGTPSYNIAK